jgi:hypothetical protein
LLPFKENSDGENINLDDMMNKVTEKFVDIPEIFKILGDESNIPLFFCCTKFTKITIIFILYNLKVKNCWSDKSFTSLLQLLGDMPPEGGHHGSGHDPVHGSVPNHVQSI